MSTAEFHIIDAHWAALIEPASAIRRAVFIEEQAVPIEEEWDGKDDRAHHFLALRSVDQQAVGTARLLPSGKLTRMAVLAAFRRQGIGSQLLHAVLAYAREHSFPPLFLDAQIGAVSFYQKFGFVPESSTFWDANILHRRMRALSVSQNPL